MPSLLWGLGAPGGCRMRPRAPAPVFGGSANPAREALVRNRRKSIPPFILGLGLSGACRVAHLLCVRTCEASTAVAVAALSRFARFSVPPSSTLIGSRPPWAVGGCRMRPRAPAPVFGGSANPAREALVRNRRKSIPPFILGLGLSGACPRATLYLNW